MQKLCRFSRLRIQAYSTVRRKPIPTRPFPRRSDPSYDLKKAVQSAGLPEVTDLHPAHWPVSNQHRLGRNGVREYNAALLNIKQGLARGKQSSSDQKLLWKQAFFDGYAKIYALNSTHLLELPLLASLYRLSILCMEETRSMPGWSIYKPFLLDLASRKPQFSDRQNSLIGSRISEWAWNELAHSGKSACGRLDDFWQSFLPQIQAEQRKQNTTEGISPVSLAGPYYAVLVATHSLLPDAKLSTFLASFTQVAQIANRDKFQEQLNAFQPATRALVKLPSAVRTWIDQAELANMVKKQNRGGEEGMIVRIKRWADVHAHSKIIRCWDAIAVASAEGEQKWIETNWVDVQGGAVELEIEESSDSTDVGPMQSKHEPLEEKDAEEEEDRPSEDSPLEFTPRLVQAFVQSLTRLGQYGKVQEIWSLLENRRLELTRNTWISLLAGYAARKAYQEIRAGIVKMEAQGWKIDSEIKTLEIRALFRASEISEGLRLIDEVLRSASAGEVVTTLAYNRIIYDLVQRDMLDRAYSIATSMSVAGPGRINTATVNTILKHHAKVKTLDLKALSSGLSFIAERGLEPDVVTFNTLIQGLLHGGKPEAAQQMLSVMRKRNIEPNERTYPTLVEDLMSREKQEEALTLLNQVEQSGHTSAVIYAILVQGFLNPPLGPDLKHPIPANLSKAHELMERMQRRAIPPTSSTLLALIEAHFRSGGRTGIEMAMKWFEESIAHSKAQGKSLFPQTLYVTLKHLDEMGEAGHIERVLSVMAERGFVPQGALARLVAGVKNRPY